MQPQGLAVAIACSVALAFSGNRCVGKDLTLRILDRVLHVSPDLSSESWS